uniref:GH18 domain-containing protein n=1 Tax=Anopheles dirus TaxID=7168 RepID=A0A182NT95_9DIPT
MSFKVIFVWAAALVLASLVDECTGQGKKFVCSYSPAKALPIGYQADYIPLEVCPYVIFKSFSFPSFVGRQMLFSDNDKIEFSRVVSSMRKRSATARVVASIDGTGRDFAATSGTNVRRKAFVQAVASILLELDADAIELNWMRPSNGVFGVGSSINQVTMVSLLQDLRQAVNGLSKQMGGRNRELWFRGSLQPREIVEAYNVFDVCDLVDHITLDPDTVDSLENAHAPLYSTPITKPASKASLVRFSSNVANPGSGYLCQILRQPGWTTEWDNYGFMPYALRALQNGQEERVSYENLDSLRFKMDMVAQKRLGGIYIDYVHSDDIYGRCAQAYSQTSYLASRVRSIPSDIGFKVIFVWAAALLLASLVDECTGQGKKFVCSYSPAKALPIDYQADYIPLEVCPYVIFKSFSFPSFVGRQMLFSDNNKIEFSRVVSSVRKRSTTARVVASIDGTGRDFTATSGTNVRRKAFVQAVASMLLELDADAVELNWISPGNSNAGAGSSIDRITMVSLLQDLRQAFNGLSKQMRGRNRELWFRGSLHPNVIVEAYNVFDICDLVDHITLDPDTADSLENAHAPLYSTPITLPASVASLVRLPSSVIDTGTGYNSTIQRWIDEGCPQKKLLLGIGLHGVSKSYDRNTKLWVGDRATPGQSKHVEHREVLCQILRQPGWTTAWDNYGFMPYALRALQNGQEERVSYENLDSLRFKMDMVAQKRLGGIYIDYVHSDDIYGSCAQAYSQTSYLASRVRSIPSDIGFAIEWN